MLTSAEASWYYVRVEANEGECLNIAEVDGRYDSSGAALALQSGMLGSESPWGAASACVDDKRWTICHTYDFDNWVALHDKCPDARADGDVPTSLPTSSLTTECCALKMHSS